MAKEFLQFKALILAAALLFANAPQLALASEQQHVVYLLQWPDQATLTDRWARFMADQEWAAIKKRTAARHGQLVGNIEDRVLTVQNYSPTQAFQ